MTISFMSGAFLGFCAEEALLRFCADKKLGGGGSQGQKIRSLAAPLLGSPLIITISILVGTLFSSSFFEGFKLGVLFAISCRSQAAWSARPGEIMPDLGCSAAANRPIRLSTGPLLFVPRPREAVFSAALLTTLGPTLFSYFIPHPLTVTCTTAVVTAILAKLIDHAEEKMALKS